MFKTKLISTLATLSNEEWSSFRKYLLMHTREESDNYEFFSLIRSRKDRLYTLDDADELRVKYFPQLSSKGLSNLMSRLFNWLEEWLVIQQLQNEKYTSSLALINAYNKRGLFKLADQTARRLKSRIQSEKGLSLEKTKALREMYHLQYYSDNPIKYRSGPKILQDLVDRHFDLFLEQSMLYQLELFNWGKIQNHDFSESYEMLEKSIFEFNATMISTELEILSNLVLHNSANELYILRNRLRKGIYSGGSELHTLVFMYSVTRAMKLWNTGDCMDAELIMDLYDYGLSSEVLMTNGKIPVIRFHNMISSLSAFGGYGPINLFIEKWSEKADTHSIESTKALANAQNAFYHEKYDLIIPLIRDIEFEHHVQKVRALGLHLIAMYEDRLNQYDLLHTFMQNFRRLLRRNRNKLSPRYFKSHLNLIRVIELLLKREIKKTDIDLSEFDQLIYRKWILTHL